MVFIMLVLTIIAFLTLDYFLGWSASEREAAAGRLAAATPVRKADAVRADAGALGRAPSGVFSAPGHTWLRLEPAGTVRLGSGELPLNALGSIASIHVPPPGSTVDIGDPLLVLRHGRRIVRLRSPVAGSVVAVNSRLQMEPYLLRSQPPETAWLCEIRPKNLAAALKRMFVGEEAAAWMEGELSRLRDFLSGLAARESALSATLADGGMPIDGLADAVDARSWEEFVERFFCAEESGRSGAHVTV